MKYNVAFANTRECKWFEGIITWTGFESKEAFDKWYTEKMKRTHRVVEEGITEERAVELVMQTPVACRLAACYQESMDPDGKLMPEVFAMNISNIMFILAEEGNELPKPEDLQALTIMFKFFR